MRSCAVLFVLLLPTCTMAATALRNGTAAGDDEAIGAFSAFKSRYGKVYASEGEEARRIAAFRESALRVASSGDPSLGVTKFSDLTPAEFAARRVPPRPHRRTALAAPHSWDSKCTVCDRFPELAAGPPTSWDWVAKGAVTAVKDQGDCGDCWTFATTGDIEGVWHLAGNALVALSEQELTSCAGNGCNGGEGEDGLNFVVKNGGIASEAQWEFAGKTGTCDKTKEKLHTAKISGWYRVSGSDGTGAKPNETAVLHALAAAGPISVVVNHHHLPDYKGGVLNPTVCQPGYNHCDHSVLIVGYGTDNGVNYWKVKNSWGSDWGEDGYFRIVRGKNACGIVTDAIHSKP